MSWAAKRRLMYILGILFVFFALFVAPPIYFWYKALPADCPSGTMRAAGDANGPCDFYQEATLQPHGVLWARAFLVRTGVYDAVAYVQNPNPTAGVLVAPYQFSFYDDQNVLVAQKTGTTFIMPESVTPIFLSDIDSGNRTIAHSYFKLGAPLTWRKLSNAADGISIDSKQTADLSTTPRLTAIVRNTTVNDKTDLTFVGVLFDTAGNAIATSQTALPKLPAQKSATIVFTWPNPLNQLVGRVDVIPVATPVVIH